MALLKTISPPSTKTLKEIAESVGIIFTENYTVNSLLNYGNNKANIESAYIDNIGKPADVNIVEGGTVIEYPSERIDRVIALARGHEIGKVYNGTNFACFYADGMADLVRDERYTPIADNYVSRQILAINGQIRSFYSKVKNNYNVLLWSRSFGGENEEGRLLNITPFISSINCEESTSGGSFSINISSPAYTWNEQDGYILDADKILIHVDEQNTSNSSFISKDVIQNNRHVTTLNREDAEFPVPFFQLVCNNNDVIFIQFEPLVKDYADQNAIRRKLDRLDQSQPISVESLWIDPSEIKGATWDMIGLIDECAGMISPATPSVITNISGRDFNKLIVEDGNYFFAADTALGRNGFLGQRNALNGINAMRNVTGAAEFLQAYTDRSVAYSLGFIFNQMTNISVFDEDGPFSGYDSDVNERGVVRRTIEEVSEEKIKQLIETYKISEEDARGRRDNTDLSVRMAPGIWRGVRILIDPELADRHLIDSSIATSQGSIKTYIDKVCQAPFAEFFGQTWGDKFYFIARKPPTTLAAFRSYEDAGLIVDIEPHELVEHELAFSESGSANWYYVEQKNSIMSANGGTDLLSFLPSGFIERQAKRYGVKASHEVSNYVGIKFFGHDTDKSKIEPFRKQASEDMQYLLESRAGVPYMRSGTIIMIANRRIRSGMFIYLKSTGEVGYVKSTSNVANDRNGTTNRATIVTVERMMVRKHIDKYFDIAKLEEKAKEIVVERTDDDGNKIKEKGVEYIYNVISNDDNISFFEKKLQFVK